MMVMIGDSNNAGRSIFDLTRKIKLESIPHFQFFNYSRNDIIMMVNGDDSDDRKLQPM